MMNTPFRRPLPGTRLDYFDAREAVDSIQPGAWAQLPYTARVHAENIVRRADPAIVTDCLRQLIERKRERDFPWFPARVVCHDILGQTALVDLAGLRDAIAKEGGDPSQVNPVVPVQLIVDHSLAVECGGFDPDAFAKNRAIEDRRNEDRFHFIEWTKKAFANMQVIPAGNGIMHQINLEKMSPVVGVLDGVAYPDTCVGTDSHTPHVDALGVIAVGVGGLEAENVMLGRASWMRLPDIVGVHLTGQRESGITATDVVLALTEFLRQAKVVGAYLEFYGEGARSLTLGDRATISNMAPEYGATAALFSIDEQTLAYLRLTGREAAQVQLVETYAKQAGLWADTLQGVVYERTLTFNLSGVVRNLAGPSNPHARVATTDLAAKGIAGPWSLPDARTGTLPDGAVVIAAITSCTNTSNPRNVIAAALLARNAHRLGLARKPWVKTSLAPGSKAVELYLKEAGLLTELEALGFGIVGFACTTCNGMSGALDPAIQQEIIDRKLYATAVLSGNRNFDGRIHPYASQAFLAAPPLVVAYALAGTVRFDIEKDVLAVVEGREIRLQDLWPSDEEIDAVVQAAVKPEHYRAVYEPMFTLRQGRRRHRGPAVRLAPAVHLHPPPAVLGHRRRGRPGGQPAHPEGHAPTGPPARQHHHRPPLAVQRHPGGQRRRRVPCTYGRARGGLQLLRHAPGRPPHRPARHLCQPAVGQKRDGAQKSMERCNPARWRAWSPKARACACGRPSKRICTAASRSSSLRAPTTARGRAATGPPRACAWRGWKPWWPRGLSGSTAPT
jgi:iron-sulfur-dependent 2-methylisocitrate dehydratase